MQVLQKIQSLYEVTETHENSKLDYEVYKTAWALYKILKEKKITCTSVKEKDNSAILTFGTKEVIINQDGSVYYSINKKIHLYEFNKLADLLQ